MVVDILLNTIDRYELTVRCIGKALQTAGHSYGLMVCDNGSSDERVIDYIRTLNPWRFFVNARNEGCAQMHNQMLLCSRANLFVLLDNDIELRRENWLRDLVDAWVGAKNAGVNPGMLGIHSDQLCPEHHAPVTLSNGTVLHVASPPKEDAIFGTRMFSREVLDKVGYFCEDYGTYSLCDNEYNTRVHHSGFVNAYISGPSGLHLGWDVGENSAYRRMKDESMRLAGPVFARNMAGYFSAKNFYLPPPDIQKLCEDAGV